MEEVRYGGLGVRLLAAIIDGIILAIPIWATEALIRQTNPEVFYQEDILVAELFKTLLWWVYIAGLTASSWQATIGMRLLSLKVTDINNNPIRFGRASLRYAALLPSLVFLLGGVIAIAFNKRKRGFHDVIAGTLVLRGN